MGTNLAQRGQSGPVLDLKVEDLNPNELAVLRFLTVDGEGRRAYTISEIMEGLGWHEPSRLKGNSRVRNALRRLVRARWVEHPNRIKDGRYQAIVPYPRPISQAALRVALWNDRLESLKRADCDFYNVCLAQALSSKWEGFSCGQCSSYRAPEQYQKEMDLIRLRAMEMARELVEQEGGPCRVRGVKPGADAKRTVKPPQEEELVPFVWPEV